MGANDSRRQSRGANQCTPHLPRHVIAHIGQVLRNRLREDLLIPVPREMPEMLGRADWDRAVVLGLEPVDNESLPIGR